MIEAVFISDLHLNPGDEKITQRFEQFIEWARGRVKTIYILGDFFHAWAGDDLMDEWASDIAYKLASLVDDFDIQIFYIHGNRDFLLGKKFFSLAKVTPLPDPYVLETGNRKILLTHGDQYCTKDKGHQWLRTLTRNSFFPRLFMYLPKQLRKKIVSGFRAHRIKASPKPMEQLEIVTGVMLEDMEKYGVHTIVHGHIHRPGINQHDKSGLTYTQYVLSDWDDTPQYLCYYDSYRIYFELGFDEGGK